MGDQESSYFPEEQPTIPGWTPAPSPARSSLAASGERRAIRGAPRALESTTYSMVPGFWEEDGCDAPPVFVPRLDPLPRESLTEVEATAAGAERARIEALYRALPAMTHFELLGLEPHADARAVRNARDLLVATLRADRCGRADAILRRKLEIILASVQHAFETLASPRGRAQYARNRAG